MAGLGPKDIDCAQIYDCFTYMVLTQLEDYGFCQKGEGGAFVEDGRLRPGGSLPVNTNGGGLSNRHPGMLGMFLLPTTLFRGLAIGAYVSFSGILTFKAADGIRDTARVVAGATRRDREVRDRAREPRRPSRGVGKRAPSRDLGFTVRGMDPGS